MMLEGLVAREAIADPMHEVMEYLQAWLPNIALLFKPIWLVGLVHRRGLRLRVVDRRSARSGHERLSSQIDAMAEATCAVLDWIPIRNVVGQS